jgi:hypothetical protein
MLFSKRKLKLMRLCLLSPSLELLLLISYLALYPISIHISNHQYSYSAPQEVQLDNFNARENARVYLFPADDDFIT